ncbi:HNH endonuclease signature motif containing protein [Herbihabitans rhizosphaerae]|nr:HNH endonuclease signature motif containing protein [Herbihabitans rhizosphaerae]
MRGQQLIDELRARETHIRQLEYERLQLIHEIHEQGLAKEMGAYSTASFLRDTVRITPADARRRVADANALFGSTTLTGQPIEAQLPVAATALAAGVISRDHVQVVRTTIDKLPDEHHAEVEQLLVGEAERFDPVKLGKLALRTRAHLQPEQVVLEEQAARKRMEFSMVEDVDGMIMVRGRLSPECAEVLKAALSPLAKPAGKDDDRSAARRWADALVELAHRVLNSDTLPQDGGRRPHLAITISYEQLRDQIGLGRGNFGALITPQTIRQIACDAGITPIVLNSEGKPLDVGREQRTATPAIRAALIARDKGCTFPGCDRPPEWTDAHHIVHWLNGGITSEETMALLCRFHHTIIHEQDWEIVMRGGFPYYIPPAWVDPQRKPIRNTMHVEIAN